MDELKPRLLMVGPVPDRYQGISVAAGHLLRSPLAQEWHIHYVATHRPEPGYREWRFLSGFRKVDELIRRGAVDVAHLHVSSGGSFYRKALIASRLRQAGIPVVVQIRGSRFFTFAEEGRVQKGLVKRFLEKADAVVVLGQRAKESLAKLAQVKRVRVIPNMTPTRPLSSPTRPPPFRVLYLGDLVKHKGVEDLVRAIPEVVRRVGEVDFMLAGEGDAGRLRDLAARLGVPARVVCPGWLKEEDRNGALKGAHLLVHPSHREQMPNAVLEGMASGLAVVATDVDALPEVVVTGKTGLLVPPRDPAALGEALCRLLLDSDLRRQMGEAGRSRVETLFSPETVAGALSTLYREVMAP